MPLFDALIFDLGGVILNIDPQRTSEAFRKLGLDDALGNYGYSYHHRMFYELERGNSSPETFRNHVRELLGKALDDVTIDSAWNAMILDIPADRIEYIYSLKKTYRIFLLSNTNEIHRRLFCHNFELNFGYALSGLFEKCYYSHQMGMRKPDPEIFKQLLTEQKLSPGKCLFIDDSAENIDSAERVGISGLHLEPGTLLKRLPEILR